MLAPAQCLPRFCCLQWPGVARPALARARFFSCIRATAARICGIAAIAGVLKYRRILEFNSLTVSRFKNTYQSVMNNNKYDQYVKKMF